MLAAIEIENFKSFKDYTKIYLNQLSLFSGINSAGKSTIAQCLLLLDQSMKMNYIEDSNPILKLNDNFVKLGKAREILNDTSKELKIGLFFVNNQHICFEFKLVKTSYDSDEEIIEKENLELVNYFFEGYENDGSYFYISCIKDNGKYTVKAKNMLSIMNKFILDSLDSYIRERIKKHNIEIPNNEYSYYNEEVEFKNISATVFRYMILEKFSISVELLINCINIEYRDIFDLTEFKKKIENQKIPFESVVLITPSIDDIMSIVIRNTIARIVHISAFRGNPLRVYSLSDEDTNPLLSISQHLLNTVKYKYDFEEKKYIEGTLESALNYWIADEFKIADKIKVTEILGDLVSEIMIYQDNKKIALSNVGFGVSQILPMVAECLQTKKGLLIIDEPESHLHPGLQAKIGLFLLHMSMLNKKIIVETHSEHIINIINYYCLKYPYLREQCASYWVYKDKNNNSQVDKIEVDEYGYVINPPDGFYDETEKISDLFSKIRQEKLLGL